MRTTPETARRFNTVGPCSPREHYMLPALSRRPDIAELIDGGYYFTLHSPRRSGETTALLSMTASINGEGRRYALYHSLELSRGETDEFKAMSSIEAGIIHSLKISGVEPFKRFVSSFEIDLKMDPSVKILNLLNRLSVDLDRDLVVFFDEADSLGPGPLIPFLRQIRNGFNTRNVSSGSMFPRSMALAGLRDIRDHLSQVGPDKESRLLASPFNIKKESLALANFTIGQIGELYCQHTEAVGQRFDRSAIERAWRWSEGQPWLVNALADETVTKILKDDMVAPVTGEIIDQAAHGIISRREVHLPHRKAQGTQGGQGHGPGFRRDRQKSHHRRRPSVLR